MRIISVIEDQAVIDKILRHQGLLQTNQRTPPKPLELQIDYSDSQLTFYEDAFDLDLGASAAPSSP